MLLSADSKAAVRGGSSEGARVAPSGVKRSDQSEQLLLLDAAERASSAGKPEEPRHRDVLVDLGPVDPDAGPDERPAAALLGRRIPQARKPLERNGQRPSILEVHDERVWDELHGPRSVLHEVLFSSRFYAVHLPGEALAFLSHTSDTRGNRVSLGLARDRPPLGPCRLGSSGLLRQTIRACQEALE